MCDYLCFYLCLYLWFYVHDHVSAYISGSTGRTGFIFSQMVCSQVPLIVLNFQNGQPLISQNLVQICLFLYKPFKKQESALSLRVVVKVPVLRLFDFTWILSSQRLIAEETSKGLCLSQSPIVCNTLPNELHSHSIYCRILLKIYS